MSINPSDTAQLGEDLDTYREELRVHCYRMTGSIQDSEDLVQECFLRALSKLTGFRGDSSLRTWLYRIATNLCLDRIRKRRRHSLKEQDLGLPVLPAELAKGSEEDLWVDPYPSPKRDSERETPETRYLKRENISLAFITLLQKLTPRQRAVLLLCDVLDWTAAEVAVLIGSTVQGVKSALHRARQTIPAKNPAKNVNDPVPESRNFAEARLLEKYLEAWHANDVAGLVALLKEDGSLAMPPFPFIFTGRSAVKTVLELHPFGAGKKAGWQLRKTSANGQPAFALYRAEAPGRDYMAFGILVLTLDRSGDQPVLERMSVFRKQELVEMFGLPPTLSYGVAT